MGFSLTKNVTRLFSYMKWEFQIPVKKVKTGFYCSETMMK